MKFRTKHLVVVCSLLLLEAVHGNSPQRMGSYDFSYDLTGAQKVRPVQVFDDGVSTFFQFRSGDPIPAIFANSQTGPVMQVPEMQGPYARVPGVARSYTLRIGYGVGQVNYSNEAGQSAKPLNTLGSQVVYADGSANTGMRMASMTPMDRLASLGAVTSVPKTVFNPEPSPRIGLALNSYATPIKGDLAQFTEKGTSAKTEETEVPFVSNVSRLGPMGRRTVTSAAKSYTSGSQVELSGREDRAKGQSLFNSRIRTIVDLLVVSGVPRRSITIKEAVTRSSVRTANASGIYISVQGARAYPVASAAPVAGTTPITIQPHTGFQEASINTWKLRATDGNVQRLLQRWADEAGWRLIWKNGPDVMITGDAVLVRDGFVSAADYVLAQAASFGHRIKGRAYNNKVLVVSSE